MRLLLEKITNRHQLVGSQTRASLARIHVKRMMATTQAGAGPCLIDVAVEDGFGG